MKNNEIKLAALKYFTVHGYEGASLSQIAEEVGIKKQSLYAHFKGKDDLFLQVLHDAKEAELSSVVQYFGAIGSQSPDNALLGFLQLVTASFRGNEQFKFWLRMSFFPPAHLADAVEQEVADIESRIQTLLENQFREWIDAGLIAGDSARTPTLAFLGVADSIMVELVYGNGGERLKDKLDASWTVFWRGISQR